MQKIILASASAQRKALLQVLNIPFDVIPAHIDEKNIRHQDLKIQAEKIARAKAEYIAHEHKGIVVAGDTFTVVAGKVLEKPKDLEEAKVMLQLLSGNKGINHNGFCYLDSQSGIDYSTTASVEFRFRKLTESEIVTYVSKFPVTTWAAAYSPAYPYAMTMIAEIKGSLTGLTHGLPMELLIPLLEKSGIQVGP